MPAPRTLRFSVVPFLVAVLLAALVATAAGQAPAKAPAGPGGTLLVFSDVHFDPFADPSLAKTLAATPASGWEAVLAAAGPGLAPYGKDANNALFLSALDAMAATVPRPDLILFPGDLLCHKFNATYADLTGDTSTAGLTAFILKTVTYFLAEVQKRFPAVPVYCAIGNNDSTLGDYSIAPTDPYLPLTAPVLAQAIPDPAARQAFLDTYPRSGHYAVPLAAAGSKGLRLVVANDIYWSTRYESPAPGRAETAWLEATLAQSRAAADEDVWLMVHIPPGADSYRSAKRLEATRDIVFEPLLAETANTAFLRLLREYAPVIKAAFAGHTHRDAFRLVTADDTGAVPVGSIRLIPSISPITGNNPGFQVYTYDPAGHALVDQTTFFLDLTAAAPAWTGEYTFAKAYGHGLAGPADWSAVVNALWTDPATAARFNAAYDVGAKTRDPITATTFPVYWLAIGHLDAASFTAQHLPKQ